MSDNSLQHEEDFFQPLLGMKGTFSRVYHVFTQHWGTFLGIHLLTSLVSFGVAFGILAAAKATHHTGVLAVGLEVIFLAAIHCLADAAIIQGVADVYLGFVPTIPSCFRAALGKAFSLLGSMLLVVGIILGVPFGMGVWLLRDPDAEPISFLLPAIVFGVYACIVSFFTYHLYSTIMVESTGPLSAIGRSLELVRENFCHTLAIVLLWALLKGATTIVTSLLNPNQPIIHLTFGGVGDGALAFVVGVLVSAIGSM